jgi:hypothetical protein
MTRQPHLSDRAFAQKGLDRVLTVFLPFRLFAHSG